MKKLLIIIFLLQLTTIYGCVMENGRDIQEGDQVNRTYDVTNFTKLVVSHAFEVNIKVGSEASLKITAGENIHQYIIVENKDNTLRLSMKNGINNVGNIKAEITVLNLKSIDASGACKISVYGISTDSFELYMSGACSGKLYGKVKKLEIELSGATNLDAKDLIAEQVEVDISGASNIKVYASKSIEAEASGASNITLYGYPEKVETDISGASNLKSK